MQPAAPSQTAAESSQSLPRVSAPYICHQLPADPRLDPLRPRPPPCRVAPPSSQAPPSPAVVRPRSTRPPSPGGSRVRPRAARLLTPPGSCAWTSECSPTPRPRVTHAPFRSRTHALSGDDFNVVFVGAGNIMFGTSARSPCVLCPHLTPLCVIAGSDEGPWNHSFRFEQCATL